jgi:NAD(P)-dependent dehydrogenase (short-subunit alcohol dehydrogenase family)
MNRIDGKIAIVTGGTQGLGKAIATSFAHAGAAGIAIVGRGVEKGEKVAAEIIGATGVPVMMIGADLGRVEDVRSIVPKVDKRFGRVDILVNAAGLTDRGTMFNTDARTLRPHDRGKYPRAFLPYPGRRHGDGSRGD